MTITAKPAIEITPIEGISERVQAAAETGAFQVGLRYALTFIGNADLHVNYEVVKRTAAFVTVTDGNETVRCKVSRNHPTDEEVIYPMGRYSMAPVLGAKDCRRFLRPEGYKQGGFPQELPLGTVTTGYGP